MIVTNEQALALLNRIREVVPQSHFAHRALYRLSRLELTLDVDTAAVTTEKQPALLINPRFLERHCRTPEHLAMLVLHELYHIVLGHTYLFDRNSRVDAIVLDAVINASLSHEFPDPAYWSLFCNCYEADRMPFALLRPPPGWRTSEERWPLDGPAGTVHRVMYGQAGSPYTYAEIAEALRPVVFDCLRRRRRNPDRRRTAGTQGGGGGNPDQNRDGESPADTPGAFDRLLGNHPKPRRLRHVWGSSLRDDSGSEFDMELSRIGGAWGIPYGAGCGGEESRRMIEVRHARWYARRQLSEAIEYASEPCPPGRASDVEFEPWPALLPYRTSLSRRADLLAMLGVSTPIFEGWLASPPERGSSRRAHVYLDVSSSMDDVLPLAYGILIASAGRLHDPAHLFSTEVFDVPIASLRQGYCRTTGGTTIECLLEHMLENRVERAIVFTDGFVGSVPKDLAERLKHVKIAVVLTNFGSIDFARQFPGARVFWLPPIP